MIPISAGDRYCIIGASGTGKTTLSLRLLPELHRYYKVPTYILNTKPDAAVGRLGTPIKSNTPPKPIDHYGIQQWQPIDDDLDAYDVYLQAILKRGQPGIVFIDELANLGGAKGTNFPIGLTRLLKQARSLRITMIICSQEAAYMPRNVIGQANHLITFWVNNIYDRRVLSTALDIQDFTIPDEHGFFHRKLDKRGAAVYYSDMSTFFGR